MQLSKNIIHGLSKDNLEVPDVEIFNLPEKVIQFGTGVLLRALPDYFIDKANRQGIFNGRIVMVKSTPSDSSAFDRQDGLYTICIRGVDGDHKVESDIINSSVSRVISASDEWEKVLRCARDPRFTIIISNTTEVGIVMSDDKVTDAPPASFPGKLLAFLYERYRTLGDSKDSGLVIVPTELIIDNGRVLKGIVTELAKKNSLEKEFIEWIDEANEFCSSLVDRIVPGALPAPTKKSVEERLGYTDELMIMAESFRLWAIEAKSPRVAEVLSFAPADKGVVIADDIEKFRELKLRILNGTHTFSCGLALQAGFTTVKEAMEDEQFAAYLKRLMMLEIAEAVSSEIITYNEACAFANTVMDRFRNPYLDHKWKSIAVNFTSKMQLRNVPLIERYTARNKQVPQHMALGFAAFIYSLRPGGEMQDVQDDSSAYIRKLWSTHDVATIAQAVLASVETWGIDLNRKAPGFADKVAACIGLLRSGTVQDTIQHLQIFKSPA